VPFTDILYVFRFWIVYLILGVVTFPLTSLIFSRFIDRGWIFSKTLGILLTTFLIWVAASLKILPFNYGSLLMIVALISIISLITLIATHFSIVSPARIALRSMAGRLLHCSRKKILLISFEELMFFSCLLLWAYVRGFQPIIEGLEKYMDFGFINSLLKAQYFPPHDMWLSGYTINYYYFGHLIAAIITLLSKIPPEIIYNLMIAVVFALCFTSSFSIGINIFYHLLQSSKIQPKTGKQNSKFLILLVGFLTAYLVTNAANLQPIYHLLTKGSSSYWYPDATRFIVKKFGATDETIHEFPHYSFVVADLHGHVSSIPNVLLIIGFVFILFLKINESRHSEGAKATEESFLRRSFAEFIPLKAGLRMTDIPLSIFDSLLLGFLLSTAYMTNAMDGPVYLMFSGIVIFGALFFKSKNLLSSLMESGIFFLLTGFTFIICSFLFMKNFRNFTGGPTLVDFRSPLWMLFILWGFQFLILISFLIFLFGKKLWKRETLTKTFAGLFGVQIKIVNESKSKESNFIFLDLFILFLGLIAFLLILFPEIFYIKDIYIHEYQRANTMFKMTYQAFIMLYIAVPYVFFRIINHLRENKNTLFFFPVLIFLIFATLGILSVSIYPYFADKSYYGLVNYRGLDGLKYLSTVYPDNYQLIKYLNSDKNKLTTKNVSIPRPVQEFDSKQTKWANTNNENHLPIILEAVGDSYTKYSNISANTGFPTVLGWPVHEWLWRNSYKADGTSIGYDLPGKRTADAQKMYESNDLNETKKLLEDYSVDYVWVGQLEREKYKNLNEKKFSRIGKVYLKFGNSTLYKVD
jgi:YYY domain-containing protein